MHRKLIAIFLGMGMTLLFLPGSAQAQQVGSVTAVFSAQAVVENPVWVPAAPLTSLQGASCDTDEQLDAGLLCNDGGGGWYFDTALGGAVPGGATFVAFGAGADASGPNAIGPSASAVVGGTAVNGLNGQLAAGDPSVANLSGSGSASFGPVVSDVGGTGVDLGAWCGLSQGEGTVNTAELTNLDSSGTTDYANLGQQVLVKWHASAGTVLPLTFWLDRNSNDTVQETVDRPAGQGAVQTTGAQPATCGVDGGGTESFFVTGYSTVLAQDVV